MTQMTVEKREEFLRVLGETGNVTQTCEIVNVSRDCVYRWRRENEEFAQAWEDTLSGPAADALEDEARRRAQAGSDVLTMFLLKGIRPNKYRDNYKIDMTAKLDINQMSEDEIREELAVLAPQFISPHGDDTDLA
jgi:transposase-like protein